ncbi:RNA polymerase II subunit 3 [Stygiomarasmius scandens]|uniref:RNA polymerase II subunit 3 n=1 Tax=Marasmiellus scandens TaxID=2682957 RepID=A0ABR1IS83_9AGAR
MSIYPDEPLEDVQWGLENLVLHASRLLTTSETAKFVNLILAGRWERIVRGNPTVSRVTLNGRQGLRPINMDSVLQTRDYDSAVMISKTLPYTHLSVWPVAPFRETLTKSNHMKGLAYHGDAEVQKYLHLIPNVPLGKVAIRHTARIFFPHMYNPDSDKKVEPKLLARLYDECIRPAVLEALRVQSSHWPTSYNSAMRQAQGTDNSGIHPFSIDLPGSVMGRFSNALLRFMDRIREFKDAYFLHEFRGRKGETLHNPGDDDDRVQAFKKLFKNVIDEDGDGYKKWFVDVAVEVNQKGFIMQWKAHAHEGLIRKALPLASDTAIAQLMDKRLVDTSAQIYDYAGFRSETGVKGKNDGVSYINVYTTDKSATYQLHKGLFSRKYPSDTLSEKGLENMLKAVDGMMKTFRECSLGHELVGEHEVDSDDDADEHWPEIKIGLEGSTRYEIRIRGDKAQGVLTGFDVDFLHDTMIAVPMTVWW